MVALAVFFEAIGFFTGAPLENFDFFESFGVSAGNFSAGVPDFLRVLRAIMTAITDATVVTQVAESKALTVLFKALTLITLTKNCLLRGFSLKLHLKHFFFETFLLLDGFLA